MKTSIRTTICLLLLFGAHVTANATDWPMLGRDVTRNAVSAEKGAPTDWQIGEFDQKTGRQLLDKSRNIKWIARLGNSCIAQPVVSNGLIWIGSNNSNPDFPDSRVDMATLLCFRERDGELLYRYAKPRHDGGRSVDYPYSPIGCSPLVEGDRLWFFTSHGEVACWDIGPLHRGTGGSKLLWEFDMNPKESKWAYGRGTRNNILSTPVLYNDRVYLGNGMQPNEREGPGRLVCLDPTKDGDISAELAVDENGCHRTHRRFQAVDPEKGDRAIANPNSGVLWEYTKGFSPINVTEKGTISDMGASVYASPIFANGTLYVASRSHLFAIQGRNDVARDEQSKSSQKLGFWPQWRGPNRDNVSTDSALLKGWPEGGPPLLWRAEGLGEGIASVSISDGRVFTLGYREEQEYVTALSEDTGEQLWMTAIGPAVAENGLMRWLGQRTPTAVGERVYAVRSDGDLVCLRVADGRELWRKSYTKDFGTRRRGWGICDYPLVDGDRLICTPGGSEATIVALNKKNGEVIWQTSVGDKEPSSYVATTVSEGGGIRQYVTFLRKGLVSLAADDGRVLWRYEKLAAPFANSVTPIVRGDSILSYNGYNSGRALLKLVSEGDGVKVQEEYFHRGFLDPFQDSTLWVGDQVHTFSNRGVLDRYDARSGKQLMPKRLGRGISSMTYADGRIYLRQPDGMVSLLEATADDYVEQSRFTIPDHELAMGATNPVVTGGRLWVRDGNRLFCYDVRKDALGVPTLPALITLSPSKPNNVARRPDRHPRSVFVPTPQDVVEKMLEATKVTKSDVLYDLGSGDGRIVITAAKKHECKALGYEIDKELVELSRERVKEAGVEQRVKIEQRDIFTADLRQADVIAVYLLPKQLQSLIPQFQELKPGARIVSHQFEIPGIKPDKTIEVKSTEDGDTHKIHIWTAPLAITK